MSETAYFHRIYDETMTLLLEEREYVVAREMIDHQKLPPQLRLQASFESMRVTSRLTQVMAWLLAQKAVIAGEISEQSLAGEFALGGDVVCFGVADDETTAALPRVLRGLLDRSLALYARVSRLNGMVRRRCTQAAAAEADQQGTVLGAC